ncbi:hypothetical protein BDZ45DRAFT_740204 [Acephala macrosclerotiorum]|nr:hypothetical protein BDZ45DRAFT_740204 [Acephala macrosclerotiorum]
MSCRTAILDSVFQKLFSLQFQHTPRLSTGSGGLPGCIFGRIAVKIISSIRLTGYLTRICSPRRPQGLQVSLHFLSLPESGANIHLLASARRTKSRRQLQALGLLTLLSFQELSMEVGGRVDHEDPQMGRRAVPSEATHEVCFLLADLDPVTYKWILRAKHKAPRLSSFSQLRTKANQDPNAEIPKTQPNFKTRTNVYNSHASSHHPRRFTIPLGRLHRPLPDVTHTPPSLLIRDPPPSHLQFLFFLRSQFPTPAISTLETEAETATVAVARETKNSDSGSKAEETNMTSSSAIAPLAAISMIRLRGKRDVVQTRFLCW